MVNAGENAVIFRSSSVVREKKIAKIKLCLSRTTLYYN